MRSPILQDKHYNAPSAFTAENLLREARRQKRVANAAVPSICVLDPDGDVLRYLKAHGRATRHPAWACYHTELHRFVEAEIEFGIVGCAVGAPFAVLVAEELFASGCQLLISMTSAGQLLSLRAPPYFILIDRALRDEGTSYHYVAPEQFSAPSHSLLSTMRDTFHDSRIPVIEGATWTTDAPFRETTEAIETMKKKGSACGRNGSSGAVRLRPGPRQAVRLSTSEARRVHLSTERLRNQRSGKTRAAQR